MLLNWLHERRNNKVIFLKKIGDFYKIVGAKYVDVKASEVKIKIDKKPETFKLTGGDLFNVHGKRLFLVDIDTQINQVFKTSKQKPILSSKELAGFLSGGFIAGVLTALDEKKYDIMSLVLGAILGIFVGMVLKGFIG